MEMFNVGDKNYLVTIENISDEDPYLRKGLHILACDNQECCSSQYAASKVELKNLDSDKGEDEELTAKLKEK